MADVIVYWGRAAVRGARRARVVRCGSRAGAPSSLQLCRAPTWRRVGAPCLVGARIYYILPHVKLKLTVVAHKPRPSYTECDQTVLRRAQRAGCV